MIQVTVHLFGHYKDVKPHPFELQVTDSTIISDLAHELAASDSRLSGLDRICRAAVNEEYAENSGPYETEMWSHSSLQ
jgi:hypothetical protein